MLGKRCYLCGGKLSEGYCQDCGLDNARRERKTYRLNYSATENRIKSRVEEIDTWDRRNHDEDTIKQASSMAKRKKSEKTGNYHEVTARQEARKSEHRNDYMHGYIKPAMKKRAVNTVPFSKNQGKTIGVIIVAVIVFIGFIADFSKDEFNTVNTGSVEVTEPSDPYEFVTRELSDTGEHFENILEPGLYKAGVNLPEGRYEIYLEEGQGDAYIDDYENSIYMWQYFGDDETAGETKEWNDVRLYEGAVLEVSGNTRLLAVTENGQTDTMAAVQNPLKEEVALTQGRELIAGKDFPAGVYDFHAISEWTSISYSIPLNTDYEDEELNFMNKTKWVTANAIESVFQNVVLPEGAAVCADDADARMVPSQMIESEDYETYYDEYRY